MSMLALIARVTPQDIEAIRRDPDCVADLLDDPLPAAGAKRGFFARLFFARRVGKPAPAPQPARAHVLHRLDDAARFDLNQSWHILHYLFTGNAWEGAPPAAFLAAGGSPVGRDLGYGPARLFSPAETAASAAFVDSLNLETLSARYDAGAIAAAEIYWQAGTTPAERAAELESLLQLTGDLRRFLGDCAAQGDGMLVDIY